MTRSLPFAVLAGASLLAATAGIAQTPMKPAAKPTAHATTATRTTTTKRTTTTTARPRMVTAKLANGKSVTYNCSLPGNATKQACK